MSGHLDLFLPEWQGFGKNASVCDGAFALRDQLGPRLSFASVDVSRYEELEVENDILGYRSNVRLLTAVRELIEKRDPETIFLVGGTCASEIAPVSFLNKRYRGDVTVLWFDAHGDLNTPQSSLTKRFHGMPLRVLLGDGPKEIHALVFSPLSRSQVILAGSRDLDPPEIAYVRENEIRTLSISELTERNILGPTIRATGSSNLYIHLDLDVLEPRGFPHLLVPTPGGMEFNDLVEAFGKLRDEFTIIGSSIVEYVPVGNGDPQGMERLVAALRPPGLL